MVPEEWKLETVGDVCNFINGNGFKASEWAKRGLPIIRIQNLNGSTDFNYFDGEPKDRWVVNPGDILFAWAGTKGVSFGAKRWGGPRGVLNQHIFRIEPKRDLDNEWLYLALWRVTQRVEEKAHGFKATLVHVQKSDITEQILHIPPLPEQKKIAQILSTWDQAITATERLLENSQKRKKGLMQQLLTGKKRLPGFEGEWRKVELGEALKYQQPTPFLVKSTEYSDEFSTPVLTAGKSFLLGYTDENFGVFSEELPVIIFDDFTTASRFVDFPFKVKSSAMKILTVKHGYSIRYIFEAMQMIKFAVGGHQRHWISIFSNMVIPCPSLEEQQAISEVIVVADQELSDLRSRLESLKQEKKALMQQLLTGKRRVNVDTEAA